MIKYWATREALSEHYWRVITSSWAAANKETYQHSTFQSSKSTRLLDKICWIILRYKSWKVGPCVEVRFWGSEGTLEGVFSQVARGREAPTINLKWVALTDAAPSPIRSNCQRNPTRTSVKTVKTRWLAVRFTSENFFRERVGQKLKRLR